VTDGRHDDRWNTLRVGDRIRFVRMPWDADASGYLFHKYIRRLYEKLIARGRPQRIHHIDEYGSPWIVCRFPRRDGRWEHHWLSVRDDSWV